MPPRTPINRAFADTSCPSGPHPCTTCVYYIGWVVSEYLKQRRKGFAFQIRVPADVRDKLGKGPVIVKGLRTRDRDLAEARAAQWAGHYKMVFEAMRGDRDAAEDLRRSMFDDQLKRLREEQPEKYQVATAPEDFIDGLDLRLDALLDEARARGWQQYDSEEDMRVGNSNPLPEDLQTKFDALGAYKREVEGLPPQRGDYALPFRELAARYLDTRRDKFTKQTIAQHEAIYRLFSDFLGKKAFAKVTRADAAQFIDEMRDLDPLWGRSPLTKQRTFSQLKALFPAKDKRITSRTLQRYLSHLAPVWEWAETRDEVSGKNPFRGIVKKEKRKGSLYQPFAPEELKALFSKLPQRAWLWEVAMVVLFSGMRANEICSLAWSDLKKEDGVWYFDISAAKSEAGIRPVPVHSKLEWLLTRRPKRGKGQVWSDLKPGGPDGKYSHYFTKRFVEWRRRVGITDGRGRVFHSFRKNAVQCLERANVPQSEAAQIVGHERAGITYAVYSPHGLTMTQRRDIVEKIKYPGLRLPAPGHP